MQILKCVSLLVVTIATVRAGCRVTSCQTTRQYPCSVCNFENLENVTAVELPIVARMEASFVNCRVGIFAADTLHGDAQPRIHMLAMEKSVDEIAEGAFDNYTNLREIRFKNNNITELPDYAFKGLNMLTKVDFSSNLISAIGVNDFTNATTITKLNLANNEIRSFWGKELKRLEDLNLENNQISVINELPKTLRIVRLSFNNLKIIENGSFSNMTSLNTLELAYNKIFKIESGALDKSINVHYVDISYNNLTQLSNVINSTNFRRFNLTGNQIAELNGRLVNTTSTVFGTIGTVQLILRQNKIVTFSSDNLNVRAKTEVDLSENLIEKLDNSNFNVTVKITEFNLARNKIKIVPSGFFSKQNTITALNLSGNSIAQLEMGSFIGLSSLERLDLSGNRINTLYEMVFLNTPSLLKLNLADNRIESLNGYEIVEVTRLYNVELEGNKFSCLDLANLIRQFRKDKVRVLYGANRDVDGIHGISCDNPNELIVKTTTSESTNAADIHRILQEIKDEVAVISDKSEAGILALILLFVIVITAVLLYTIFIKTKTIRRRFAITDEEEESIM